MSSEPTAASPTPVAQPNAAHRQRFGLIMAVGLGFFAAGVSYFGTKDAWVTGDRRPDALVVAPSGVAMDPACEIDLPEEPHRDVFQTSCLTCHSARLALSQPAFNQKKWVEIVHKMVAVYGAPMTPEDESGVVDYLLAARPPGR